MKANSLSSSQKFILFFIGGKLFYLNLIILIAIAFSIIFLIHWSIYKVLSWVFTCPGSLLIIVCFYYFTGRKLVRILAFPGYFGLFRRNLELSYCKSMGAEVLRSIIEFKSSLEMFLG